MDCSNLEKLVPVSVKWEAAHRGWKQWFCIFLFLLLKSNILFLSILFIVFSNAHLTRNLDLSCCLVQVLHLGFPVTHSRTLLDYFLPKVIPTWWTCLYRQRDHFPFYFCLSFLQSTLHFPKMFYWQSRKTLILESSMLQWSP